jgi:hypothetical protein
MKHFFILVTISTLSTSFSALSKTAELLYEGRTHVLDLDEKKESYISKGCEDLKKCFFQTPVKLTIYQNQSPGFSLCYQLKGDAFFGEIKGLKEKIPMCQKDGKFADQESLLLYYRDKR